MAQAGIFPGFTRDRMERGFFPQYASGTRGMGQDSLLDRLSGTEGDGRSILVI